MSLVVPDATVIELVKGRDNPWAHRIFNADETPATVTGSPTAQMYKAGVAVGSAVTGSWDSGTGTASGTFPAAATASENLGDEVWTVVVTATVAGQSETFERPAALRARGLYPPVLVSQITTEYPDLLTPLGASAADLQGDRDEAWAQMQLDYRDRGVFLARVKDLSQVADVLRVKVAAIRYGKAGMAANDNGWLDTAQDLHAEYVRLLERPLVYDADQDGAPDTEPKDATGHDWFSPPRRF